VRRMIRVKGREGEGKRREDTPLFLWMETTTPLRT